MAIKVINPGLSTTGQDLGRPGLAAGGVGYGERRDDRVERRAPIVRERRHFGDVGFRGKRQQPGHFHAHALANQCELAELLAQRVDLRRVAAVERRQRGQACVFGVVHGIFESNRV